MCTVMLKDKLKKVIKEGGKRGVEIEGAADMGGLQFFCTSMDIGSRNPMNPRFLASGSRNPMNSDGFWPHRPGNS